MTITDRVNSFAKLGIILNKAAKQQHSSFFSSAERSNPWFTPDNIQMALEGLGYMLSKESLENFTSAYSALKKSSVTPKKVGLIMAGNIPAVGFHDMMCVLLSGHKLIAKKSSKDDVLPSFITEKLIETDIRWKDRITFSEQMKDIDAIITTGSDNSARYFQYYFSQIPHIIRKNRSSVAILKGDESNADLQNLARDVFSYFGLGCRNISKFFIPHQEILHRFMEVNASYASLTDHHKYANNYLYNKVLYTMNLQPHFDSGYAIFTQNEQHSSPVAVIFYQTYQSVSQVAEILKEQADKIQCISAKNSDDIAAIPFGKCQLPEINDFADGIDTMEFLVNLQ
ncbi:MAG: acyl-CoA reductase [Cyclobacteriaceae bacterium]|nr:acyl-CoA reductase [Cyclobacteriaceae bacterium]